MIQPIIQFDGIGRSEAPVRLCCSQRHFGPVCPDGLVMCCICFDRVTQDKLHVLLNGQKEDVCDECAAKEGAFNADPSDLE